LADEKHRRGFASMSPEKRREISSQAGRKAHELGRAHQWKPGMEAEKAWKKGLEARRSKKPTKTA